jgi:MATE family multidrug resistance protein
MFARRPGSAPREPPRIDLALSPQNKPRADSYARVAALAWPIILANLTQPLLSAVDTGVAGHLPGSDALGGVAVGGLFCNLALWGCGFLRMGTSGLIAQARGAGDPLAMRDWLWRGLILAALLGIAMLLLRHPVIDWAVAALGGSKPVQASAIAYAGARLWSAPATLIGYVVLADLMARQRARTAMLLQLLINVANAVLAIWFVFGWGLGVEGLGAATALADGIGAAAGAAVLLGQRDRTLPSIDWVNLIDGAAIGRLMAVNRDIFLRTLALLGAYAWFAHAGAALGDTVLAANALLLNLHTFTAYVLDGFAQAVETLAGAAAGRRDREALRRAVRASLVLSGVGALGLSLAYIVIGVPVIRALTDLDAVRAAAVTYLPWAILSPVVSVWCYTLDGVYIGTTRTRALRDGMVLSLIAFAAANAALLPLAGNHGLWAALLLFQAVRGGILFAWLGRIDRGWNPVSQAVSTAADPLPI